MLSEASYHNMTVGRIPSVEGGIQPTLLTTKGDIIVATGNATLVRQGVGANGTVLTANSAQADGVEWAAIPAAASGLTYITGASFSAASSVSLPNSTFTSTYQNYMMKLTLTGVSANSQMCYRMRAGGTDTSSAIYYWSLTGFAINNTAFTNAGLSETSMKPHNLTATADYDVGDIAIYQPQTTQITRIVAVGGFASNGGTVGVSTGAGFTPNTTQYDAMTFFPSSGTITGSYKVYGIANS